MIGIDPNKQVIDLWYEVTYIRILISKILDSNPEIAKCIGLDEIIESKFQAQQIVQTKFPKCKIDFEEIHNYLNN
jgi:hypothetical protein